MSAAEIALRFGIPIAVSLLVTVGFRLWERRREQKYTEWIDGELQRLRETDE